MSVAVIQRNRIDEYSSDIEAIEKPVVQKLKKIPRPEGGVKARCIDADCQRSFHWYVMPDRAVSGKTCWDCGAELFYNHKNNTVFYKGDDSCVCYMASPLSLIANARDLKKGRK